MDVEICRHALDRVPLSLIIDDSTALVNLNYFFLRDRTIHRGEQQRWEDVPVAHPESFTREWAEWCHEAGVRGKFSVVPNPAALGRIDQGLALFGQKQLDSWLRMCRETIMPSFDITPEMLTHTHVLDLATLQPRGSRIWEQYEWGEFTENDGVDDYIALSCQILANLGLSPQGVTSPGGFGHRCLDLYARMTGQGCRRVTGLPAPYFFQRLVLEDTRIDTPVWYPDAQAGTAVGEIIACTDDYTGSWTGYGAVDAAYYITPDLQGGRLPAVIDAGSPCVICSHWQGMYGLAQWRPARVPHAAHRCRTAAPARPGGHPHALAHLRRDHNLCLRPGIGRSDGRRAPGHADRAPGRPRVDPAAARCPARFYNSRRYDAAPGEVTRGLHHGHLLRRRGRDAAGLRSACRGAPGDHRRAGCLTCCAGWLPHTLAQRARP